MKNLQSHFSDLWQTINLSKCFHGWIFICYSRNNRSLCQISCGSLLAGQADSRADIRRDSWLLIDLFKCFVFCFFCEAATKIKLVDKLLTERQKRTNQCELLTLKLTGVCNAWWGRWANQVKLKTEIWRLIFIQFSVDENTSRCENISELHRNFSESHLWPSAAPLSHMFLCQKHVT